MEQKKFLIIDGHAMAFRAYYAMAQQNLTDSRGNPTETIFGFFRMLGKLIDDLKPDYLVTAFDHPQKSFRHKKYDFYKANRGETPESFRYQMQVIYEIFDKLGLPKISLEGYEADDIIYTLAGRHAGKGVNVRIVSGDKDLFSILSDDIIMLRPKKGVSEFKTLSGADILEEIGVMPEQVFDYMALTGDTSDNVPGVKGVGAKTAAKLIQEYGSLNNIYKNIDSVKPDSLKSKLENEKENAYLSLELVSLVDFDFEHSLDDFVWNKNNTIAEHVEIFREYDLPTLFNEWSKLFSGGITTAAQTNDDILANFIYIDSHEKWLEIEKRMMSAAELSVDTETTSVDSMSANLVGASFAWRENKQVYAAYIPVLFDREHEYHLDYQNMQPGETVIEWIKPVLENAKIPKIGQNIKYDTLVLKNHGVQLAAVEYDTMVISYLLDPNSRKHNLDDLAFDHLEHTTIKYNDLTGTGRKAIALVQVPPEALARYAAEDAEVALRLKEKLYPRLEEENLLQLYNTIDKPMVTLLGKMQENGICLDPKYIQTLDSRYQTKLDAIEKKIHELAGEVFNINSTKELQCILFDKLDIKSSKKTAKGALSTQASVLENLRDQHPVVEQILQHRTLSKLLTTYIHTLPGFINAKTGRVHTSLSQTIAATGRLASFEPNLQNIPIKGEDGAAIRKGFIAPLGSSLLSLDYSQIELRILAHYSEDKNLKRAYELDEDIHDQAAYLLFHRFFDPQNLTWSEEPLDKTPEEFNSEIIEQMRQTADFIQKRSQAKILNFSIAYGVTEYGLSRNLNISIEEARDLIRQYFQSFPGIQEYIERTIAAAKEMGYSINYFGRKRKVDNINHSNRFLREAAERLAINNPIQSTAADLIKVAMLYIQNEFERRKLKSKMILQVHDELLFEVPDEEKDETYELVKYGMENAIKLDVPLKVSGGFGANWQEAK